MVNKLLRGYILCAERQAVRKQSEIPHTVKQVLTNKGGEFLLVKWLNGTSRTVSNM